LERHVEGLKPFRHPIQTYNVTVQATATRNKTMTPPTKVELSEYGTQGLHWIVLLAKGFTTQFNSPMHSVQLNARQLKRSLEHDMMIARGSSAKKGTPNGSATQLLGAPGSTLAATSTSTTRVMTTSAGAVIKQLRRPTLNLEETWT
jgi:hypothetical protein